MSSSEYWKKRFELLEQSQNQLGIQCYAEIEKQYRKAQRQIEGQLLAWYQRFADNNRVTMQEARKMLTKRELEEFKWDVNDYIRYGKANAILGNWEKQLENASARYHISRLEALKIHTQQHLEVLFGNQTDMMDTAMRKIYTSGYYHTAFEIQKGIGVGWNFATLDEKKISKVINKPWAADGKNFSQRIWNNRQKLVNELHTELTRNVILGQDPQKAIDAIARKMKVSKSNAGRLVMTEQAYFSSEAQKECFTELDVEQFEIVATLDSLTSDICRKMDGEHFPMSQWEIGTTAPPFHARCRTTTAPYFDDDFDMVGQRAARGKDGKTYYVPADMKYKDWEQAFVEGENEEKDLTNKLAVRNGNIYGINTINGNDIPQEMMKKIDKSLHNMFKEMPYMKTCINEILFDDLGVDIARATINKDLNIRLKINSKYFSSDKVLKSLLQNQPKELSLKNGLDGYFRHEFVHFQEYHYAIKKNTHDGEINKIKAFEEIKQGTYAKELLKEALEACKMAYTYDIIFKISEYATYNASETIAEAVSYGENDSELCETIKKLVKRKWSE